MSRLISVAYTTEQVEARVKTVSRRTGWWETKNQVRILTPGDHLTACKKVMGRKPGEPLVRITDVEVLDVRREPLIRLLADSAYGAAEMVAEGFPGMDPEEFIRRFFEDAQNVDRHSIITRIEWAYLSCTLCRAEIQTGDLCTECVAVIGADVERTVPA